MTTRPLNGLAAISLDELRPSPNNPRTQLTDIDDLAASIREAGLIQPIVVQNIPGRDGYQIVAGPVGRPKGAKTKPCFGHTHPLAATVLRLCSHRGSPKVGGVGCGPCWETVIRADAQAVAS